ncbi:hypothetical protein IV494_11715 [Kaistella sp. G5-32]|uniref:Uncharacterized protein n=1 Tax=Kaistella gelatinilytica TaxID=2787636 RepID=A0ABS0FDW2_9FLAO|nr:hypothetical protein [Kaistella gelatinilytica]MBF8457847.1 hypothetical protein [Kaistella gelatinilytica]
MTFRNPKLEVVNVIDASNNVIDGPFNPILLLSDLISLKKATDSISSQ